MQSEALGFGEWPNRHTAWLTGIGFWVAGFAVAGAASWQMHHAPSQTQATLPETAAPTCDTTATDMGGEMFMPLDIIVVRREQLMGATEMQK